GHYINRCAALPKGRCSVLERECMSLSRRDFLRLMGVSAVGVNLPSNIGWTMAAFAEGNPGAISPERHLLNRMTWGVRPQDVDILEKKGIEGYIDWQLDYEAIEDPLVSQFVAARPMLAMGA